VLDGTPPGTGEDYPSIAQVRDALTSANLYPIFAVTAGNTGTYQALVSGLGRGDVVTLASNSSNLIAAIQNGIENYKVDFIENLVGTGQGDTLTGNGLANNIEGGEGNDTLSGLGGNDTLIGGGDSDVAVFRGSRSEYDFSVAEDGALVVAHARGTQEDGTDNVKSVEYLRFADTIDDIPVEDFYPASTLPGIAEKYPLTTLAAFSHAAYNVQDWETDRIVVDEKVFDLNLRDQYAHAQSSVQLLAGDGWTLLTAGAIGLTGSVNARGVEYQNGLDYAQVGDEGYIGSVYYFDNGYYASKNAAAMVAQKGDTLILSFRGTNDGSGLLGSVPEVVDSDDWVGKENHYEKLLPLVEAIYKYVLDDSSGVAKLYVTGHSLGGAMVTAYLTDMVTGAGRLAADGVVQVAAVAFAAPGYPTSAELPAGVDYYLRFELDHDLTPDTAGAKPGTQININTDSLDKHDMRHYLAAVSELDDAGLVRDLDLALARATTFGEKLTIRVGDVYPAGEKQPVYMDKSLEVTEPFFVVGSDGADTLTGDRFGSSDAPTANLWTLNDTFYPGGGLDTIYGGNAVTDYTEIAPDVYLKGIDTVVYGAPPSLPAEGGTAMQFGPSHFGLRVDGTLDTLYEIEQLHFVSAPSAGADLLAGGSGVDEIDGSAGNDWIYGGSGNDRLIGGPGDDRIHGGVGIDAAVFNSAGGSVSIENWAVKVESTEGVDRLYSVEQLEFTDESVSTVAALRETYSNSDLLRLYAPVLALESDDYVPTKIEAFLDHAILFERNLTTNEVIAVGDNIGAVGDQISETNGLNYVHTIKTLLSDTAGVAAILESGGDYYLDFINGDQPGDRQDRGDSNPGSWVEPDSGDWHDAAGQELSFDATKIDDEYGAAVYARAVQPEGTDSIYLQYYFFYLENDWTDYTDVEGFHEGDWEFMQIELDSATYLPTAFWSSTHLVEGQVRNPFDVDISHANNHIVSYVVDGGHGTYFTAGSTEFGPLYGNGNDVRYDEKLLIPSSSDVHESSLVIRGGTGGVWNLDGRDVLGYELIEVVDGSDSFEDIWLGFKNVTWGHKTEFFQGAPPAPSGNKDLRWDSPELWVQNHFYGFNVGDGDVGTEGPVDSDNYAIDESTGDIQIAGLPRGEMEMGFLFDDTDLAALGHFDLV
jgi:Ca2+-binding RTX toxin-like protein